MMYQWTPWMVLLALAACDKPSSPSALVSSPSASPALAASQVPPEQALADQFARTWKLMDEGVSLDGSVTAWYQENGFEGNKNSDHFRQRFHVVLRSDPGLPKGLQASHEALLRKLVAAHHPVLASRLESTGAWKRMFDHLACQPSLYVNGKQLGGCSGQLDVAPAVPDAGKACADYLADWAAHIWDKEVRVKSLREELGRSTTDIDALIEKIYGVSYDRWLDGAKGELDLPKLLTEAVARHHPEIAEKFTGYIQERMAQWQRHVQSSVTQALAGIHNGEFAFCWQDLDRNGVPDYWTADLSGLYRFKSDGKALHLLSPEDAASDVAPLAEHPDLEAMPVDAKPRPYAFRAIPSAPDAAKKWTSSLGFAFCAYPKAYGRRGRQSYVIDQTGVIWFKDTEGQPPGPLPTDPAQDGWTRAKDQPVLKQRENIAALIDQLKERPPNLSEFSQTGFLAIPALLEGLRQDNVSQRNGCLQGLRQFSPNAVGMVLPLVDTLGGTSDAILREGIADLLSSFGGGGKAAAPRLSEFIKNGTLDLRRTAARVLGRIARETAIAAILSVEDPAESSALMETLGLVAGEWIELLGAPKATTRRLAAKMLGEAGAGDAKTVSALLGGLKDPDVGVREASARSAARIGTSDEVIQVLLEAAEAENAGGAGPIARGATPAFLLGLSRPKFSEASRRMLRKLGPTVVPELVARLESEDPQVRYQALAALGDLGGIPPAAVPKLQSLARSAYDPERRSAVVALARLGGMALDPLIDDALADSSSVAARAVLELGAEGGAVVPKLIAALKGDGPSRLSAIRLLGRLGPSARPALPELAALLLGRDQRAAEASAESFASIGGPPPELLAGMLPALNAYIGVEGATGRVIAQNRICAAIATFGTAAVTPLMGQLKSGKPEAREWSAVALGLIGPDAASAAPLLDQVLNDEQAPDLVRSAAAASLVRIRPAMPDIGSLLAKWMGSYVDRIVDRVQETFRRMGPAAKSAVPKIAEMATNPKGGFPRYRTMNILSMIGRDGNPEVLAALTKILMEDPSDEFAGSAAHSMMELKSAAVPALIQALGLKSPRRRSWAARTLGRNGKDASAGCDALKRLLQDPEGEVRREAAVALWRITAKPEGLIEILSDTSQRGLGNVAEALDILAEIGPPAQSAVPQLLEALKGEHAADAASALGKIGKKDDGVLSALMVAGGREDEQIRASVAQAFGNLGVTTPEVLAWLRASTRADTVTVRVEAWASLAVLSKDADALPMLIVEIDETGRGDNVAVAAALVRIGPDARVTVPALERALKNTRGYQHGELEKHLRTITGK